MSNTKKDDLPYMPFYVGDWLKATDIQVLPYELKGLWFEMLCYMWESKERGVLLYSREELSRLLRLPEVLLEQKLKQLEKFAIYSVRDIDGAIYSRRMVKDQKIREIRKKCGEIGGKASFASRFAQAKSQANADIENDIENENINKEKGIVKGKGFTKPTVFEVKSYCIERKNKINAQTFIDFYESKGWMIGKNKMVDWKSAVRTWEKRDHGVGRSQPPSIKYQEVKKLPEVNPAEREKVAKMISDTARSMR